MYDFQSLSIDFTMIFGSWSFSHFTPQFLAVIRNQRNSKFFGLETVMERGILKTLAFLKTFGKIILKP